MICPQCGTLNDNQQELCKRCSKALHPSAMKGKIPCSVHANREATTSCAQCGSRLCPTCAVNVGGVDFCEDCAPADAVTMVHDEDYERIPVLNVETAEIAPFWSRFVALVIDAFLVCVVPAVIIVLVAMMFGLPFDRLVSARQGGLTFYIFWFIFLVVAIVYSAILISMNGQTVGKRVMGVIVLAPDGHILTWDTSAQRAAASVLSAVPLGLGFLWALWDKNGETWHDKLAGTRSYKWEEMA